MDLTPDAPSDDLAGQSGDPGRRPKAPPGVLLTALTTEHFVLQSMASTATSEAGNRCSLYLMSLSSSLVALGFVAQASHAVFAGFAAAVLPTVFLLGCITVSRLVDTTVTNINCLRQIAHIRGYYAGLDGGLAYFPSEGNDSVDSLRMMGITGSRSSLWFTMASVVGIVNGVVAGAGVALALGSMHVPVPAATPAGVLVAAGCAGIGVAYQRRRLNMAFPENPADRSEHSAADQWVEGGGSRWPADRGGRSHDQAPRNGADLQ